jgi:hypothetical protein
MPEPTLVRPIQRTDYAAWRPLHGTNTAGRTLYDKLASHTGFIVYTQEI